MTDSNLFWIAVGILTVGTVISYISKSWGPADADRFSWIMGVVLVCLLVLMVVAFL